MGEQFNDASKADRRMDSSNTNSTGSKMSDLTSNNGKNATNEVNELDEMDEIEKMLQQMPPAPVGKKWFCDGKTCHLIDDQVDHDNPDDERTTGDANGDKKKETNTKKRADTRTEFTSTLPLVNKLGIKRLVTPDDKAVDIDNHLKDKIILLYFSASWCGPCRAFSPILSEFAEKNAKDVVVIFVSNDHSKDDMMVFLRKRVFVAIPFSHRNIRSNLLKEMKISGIPSVIVLHPDGDIVSTWGRSAVMKNPDGCVKEWKKKKSGIGFLNLLKFW